MPEDRDDARLLVALADLAEASAASTPEEAADTFDATVSEVFFRDWPAIRDWGESVWHHLDEDLGREATPESDFLSPETGVVD